MKVKGSTSTSYLEAINLDVCSWMLEPFEANSVGQGGETPLGKEMKNFPLKLRWWWCSELSSTALILVRRVSTLELLETFSLEIETSVEMESFNTMRMSRTSLSARGEKY